MKRIYLCGNTENIDYVYSKEVKKELSCNERVFSRSDVISCPEKFSATEYIFSTWGMPVFSSDEIRRCFPALKCVFYAAGSVQEFARPFLQNGIRVFSAWAANAVPVAEYTLAQILLANKGFFHESILRSRGDITESQKLKTKFFGNFNTTVGIIGAGMVGKKVIELLKPFKIKVLVFDPFLSSEKAKELGVETVNLERLFSESQVISNHLANNDKTRGMLHYGLFRTMKPYSSFINTGRGAQVIEDDLVRVLTERRDIFALLDVTEPEPPHAGHPFYNLDNCILTPHIAGSLGKEVHRMAEYMLEEYRSFTSSGVCKYEVTEEMLATMA